MQDLKPPMNDEADLSALEDGYNPVIVEKRWHNWWTEQNLFTADNKIAKTTREEQKFVMVIPPPNVTGSLHIGHTLTVAIEDTLTRWHRMLGHVTLWVPGTDHAGIATQTVVERRLLRDEGITKHDIGREEFVSRVWSWKKQYGSTIQNQLRRIGASVDWSREVFTMDKQLSKAVIEAFVTLYNRGLIYRDTKLVSWSPFLNSAISDIEVDVEEIEAPKKLKLPGFEFMVEVGVLWHFSYPIEGCEQKIEVATTRIETMLGDVAVAVHPDDSRFKHLIGRKLLHPFCQDRHMTIIADKHVDPQFGTGAVKVTPAHDKNDYEIGKRHGLENITIFTKDGKINENGGKFNGMHRFECRFKIQDELKQLGLLGEKKPNTKKMQLPRCTRSGDIVEYMLVPQWWINCKGMAERALKVVEDGKLSLIPSSFNSTWFHWLENIRDWCISRQLWWGHRIPAYRIVYPKGYEDKWVVGRDMQEAESYALKIVDGDKVILEQDEDVLDTWFSSSLFPFSVFGWPDTTADMSFFPTSLLETGHDILFFWVARMVMMSLELLDTLPFKNVFLHTMVRDSHGKKMSKSKGNVIDPVEVIEGTSLQNLCTKLDKAFLTESEKKKSLTSLKTEFPDGIPECGADALRYGLLAYSKQGRSINLSINRVVGYRHFCNKLWNAVKFALKSFPAGHQKFGNLLSLKSGLEWTDRWILHRLSQCCKLTNAAFSDYQFSDAVTSTYNFWLYELCDIYLELIKKRVNSDCNDRKTQESKEAALEVLYTCLDYGLRLLHPMIPFVTEELYQRLPDSHGKVASIAISDYPQEIISWTNSMYDDDMRVFMSIVRHFRSLCSSLDVPPKQRPTAYIRITQGNKIYENMLSTKLDEIAVLAKVGKITFYKGNYEGSGIIPSIVDENIEVLIDPAGSINIAQTHTKLSKKLNVAEKSLQSLSKKVTQYDKKKVPEEVHQGNLTKMELLHTEIDSLKETLSKLSLN